jgi:hypothetical protein
MATRSKTAQVVIDDFVGQTEIAEHFGVDRRLVGMWIHRGPGNGFPAPVKTLAAGKFYLLSEVAAWHAGNDRVTRGKEKAA